MKILIVEDDASQAIILADFLKKHNFSVDIAGDGNEALNYLEIFPYDLIVLDLLLPKLDGITLCKQLRQKNYQIPILLLTVQKSLKYKVDGLSSGADDYLVKPFETEELLARVQSLLRRGHIPIKPDLVWENLRLSLNNSQVTYNGTILKLTRTEYGFLELFLRHPRQLFSAEQMTSHQYASDHSYSIAAVRSHIKGLRHKLNDAGVPNLIETVYGLGYRLREDPTLSQTQISTNISYSNPERIEKALATLVKNREKFRPTILQQIDLIQQLSQQINSQSINPLDLQTQIQQETHKLTGLLGILGFTTGSKYCSEIEILLNQTNQINPEQARQIRGLVVAIRQGLTEPLSDSVNPPNKVKVKNQGAKPQLLVVDNDAVWAQRIQKEATHWGFTAIAATTHQATRHHLQQQHPDVLLIDFHLDTSSEENFNFLVELTQLSPPIPILVLSTQGSFSTRVEVARLKPHAFLQKPMIPREVMVEVNRAFQQAHLSNTQILIVDDHPSILRFFKDILEPYGLNPITFEDSRLFWKKLEQETPDLVILDVKMPHVNGIDLCQVIRNDPRWHTLPILVLTAFDDIETIQQVLAAGADDVVSKAIAPSELIARVMNRLKRTPRPPILASYAP